MGVDVFAHLFLEERPEAAWTPVKLVARRKHWSTAAIAPGVSELVLPYEELGNFGYRALSDLAVAQFGLKKRSRRSRGLPKDTSPELRMCFEEAREDALAQLDEGLAEEYANDLSLGEGWITAEELEKVDWNRASAPGEATYREILGATFFAQIARIQALAATRTLRIVHWFTI